MSRATTPPLPTVARTLETLGKNVRLARLRRNIAAEVLAERAGMSRPTLRALERGEPGVTLGSLANVLHSLGLVNDLLEVARDDVLGRKLEDAELDERRRVRAPKRSEGGP